MRLWRLIHGLRVNFGFILLATLIIEGLLALPLMFIFPPAALGLVFLGLATLALSLFIQALLTFMDTSLARHLGIETPSIDGSEATEP